MITGDQPHLRCRACPTPPVATRPLPGGYRPGPAARSGEPCPAQPFHRRGIRGAHAAWRAVRVRSATTSTRSPSAANSVMAGPDRGSRRPVPRKGPRCALDGQSRPGERRGERSPDWNGRCARASLPCSGAPMSTRPGGSPRRWRGRPYRRGRRRDTSRRSDHRVAAVPREACTRLTRRRFSLRVPVLSKHTTLSRASASTELGLRISTCRFAEVAGGRQLGERGHQWQPLRDRGHADRHRAAGCRSQRRPAGRSTTRPARRRRGSEQGQLVIRPAGSVQTDTPRLSWVSWRLRASPQSRCRRR